MGMVNQSMFQDLLVCFASFDYFVDFLGLGHLVILTEDVGDPQARCGVLLVDLEHREILLHSFAQLVLLAIDTCS